MKGLLSRIPRRRRSSGAVRPDGQTAPIAGVDPAALAAPGKPSFRDRGRLRRRLRYLRRVRELGFRDLGGLVFDQHRFNRPSEELVRGKLGALLAVDGELRALEALLDDRRPIHELREPGITACVRCGAIHGSDARFCPSCGVPVTGARAFGEVAQAPAATAATAAATTATPSVPPEGEPVVTAALQAPPSSAMTPADPPAAQPTEIPPSEDGDDEESGRFGRLLRRRRPSARGDAPADETAPAGAAPGDAAPDAAPAGAASRDAAPGDGAPSGDAPRDAAPAADDVPTDDERAPVTAADDGVHAAGAAPNGQPAGEEPTEALPAVGEQPPVTARDES